ncbi:MAG: hypothetical protein ACJAYU_005165 [Bradymonadia bacterium]|jgi:hypothetical protein
MMSKQANKRALMLTLLTVTGASATACYDAAEYIYGDTIDGAALELYSSSVGIHPDSSVLDDPNNPFADSVPSSTLKWEIESYADNVAAFYSWASVLALEPTGEHQFYAALNLAQIYENGQAVQEDLESVKGSAIAAYQSVLDNFPDAESFDSTGTFSFDLVTPSYLAILELGAIPDGDWVLVAAPNGQPMAVRP